MINVSNFTTTRDNEITINGACFNVSDSVAQTILDICTKGLSATKEATKEKKEYKYKDVDVKLNIGIQEVKTIDGKKFYRIQNKGALYRGKGKVAFKKWIESENVETASCQFDNGRKLVTWTAYGFKTKKACQTFIDNCDKVFSADELNAIEF